MKKFIKSNLQDGEVYAGVILGQNGEKDYHLILRPEKPKTVLSWEKAMKWADSIKYQLPTLREQSLLFANCNTEFEKAWYWSSEQYSLYDGAWVQSFNICSQSYDKKLSEYYVRAIRRLYETE